MAVLPAISAADEKAFPVKSKVANNKTPIAERLNSLIKCNIWRNGRRLNGEVSDTPNRELVAAARNQRSTKAEKPTATLELDAPLNVTPVELAAARKMIKASPSCTCEECPGCKANGVTNRHARPPPRPAPHSRPSPPSLVPAPRLAHHHLSSPAHISEFVDLHNRADIDKSNLNKAVRYLRAVNTAIASGGKPPKPPDFAGQKHQCKANTLSCGHPHNDGNCPQCKVHLQAHVARVASPHERARTPHAHAHAHLPSTNSSAGGPHDRSENGRLCVQALRAADPPLVGVQHDRPAQLLPEGDEGADEEEEQG